MSMDVTTQQNINQLELTMGSITSATQQPLGQQLFQCGPGQMPLNNLLGQPPLNLGQSPFAIGQQNPLMQTLGTLKQLAGMLQKMTGMLTQGMGQNQQYGQPSANSNMNETLGDLGALLGDAANLAGDAMMTAGTGGLGAPKMLMDSLKTLGDAGQLVGDLLGQVTGNQRQSPQTGCGLPQDGSGGGLPNWNPLAGLGPSMTGLGDQPISFSPPGTIQNSSQMDDDTCIRELDSKFDKLSGGKDQFTTADLQRAAADQSDPTLAAAAQHMLDNQSLRDGVDTADQHDQHQGAKTDGIFSRGDLAAALQGTGNAQGDEAVTQTLMKYSGDLWSKGHGTLNKQDFEKLLQPGATMPDGKPVPEDLKDAARNLLSKPSLFDKLDSALKAKEGKGAQLDGKISLQDLQQVSSESTRGPGETATPVTPQLMFANLARDTLSLHLQNSQDNNPFAQLLQRLLQPA